MKITLISPNSNTINHSIRSLSATLKKYGHEVMLVHLLKDNGRELLENESLITPYPKHIIADVISLVKDSDIVGITLMSQFLAVGIDLTDQIRKNTKAKIIWGGIHPTMEPDSCLKYVDCICVGEGEEAFSEFVTNMAKGKDFYSTRNFWFRKEGKVIRNPLRPYLQNLDSLPFQDYSFENQFVLWDKKIQTIKKHMVGTTYSIFATRGCPNRCAYCCTASINNLYRGQKILRVRSPNNIIAELKAVTNSKEFLGWKRVRLADDLFPALPISVIEEFAQMYKKEIGLPFSVGGWTPQTVNDEKVKILLDAGMNNTRMGIQSGSANIRRQFLRSETDDSILKAAKIFNHYKKRLHVTYDLISDNPYEKTEDTIDSFRLFSRIPRPYHITVYSLAPFPGTEVYKWAVRDKMLTGDWLTDLKFGKFGNRYLSREYKYTYEDTYFNNLYLIFQAYPLPRLIKSFLINTFCIKIKIIYPLYYILKFNLGIVRYIKISKDPQQFKSLLKRGLGALRKGDFARIFKSVFMAKRTW